MEVLPPFVFKCDGKLLAYLEGSMTGGSGPGWQHCARKSTGFGIREVRSKFPYTNRKLASSSRGSDASLVHDR